MSEAREVYCVKCGCIESAEEMVYVASEDAYYCKDCAESEGFEQCERCGEWHRVDDLTIVHTSNGEEAWCGHCVNIWTFECEHCGEVYSELDFDSRNVSGEDWCEDCVAEEAVECYECGDLIPRDYATYVESGGYHICDYCRDEHYDVCEDCGEYIRREDLYYSCGRVICNECASYNDWWHYCYECGNWVYEDNWDYDSECCNDCIGVSRRSENARVRSYHGDEPPMRYFGKYGDVFKGLGIELEIDRECSNTKEKQLCLNELDELFDNRAYFKYDGSLNNGIEIVTLPHTLEEFYKLPWYEALTVCKNRGYSSHNIGTCGLHVHISRTLFGDDEETQSDNIAKLMQFYNIYWDDIIKISRRTNEQVMRWAGKYPTVRKDSLKKWSTKAGKYSNRYMAVNVTNDHTVEIRINRGTLNSDTFLATIDFVMTTAVNSTKIGWADVSDDYMWLKGLKKKTLDYIQGRSAFYEPVEKYLHDYWVEENERRREEYARQRAEAHREAFDIDSDLEEGLNAIPSDFDEIMEMINRYSEQPIF